MTDRFLRLTDIEASYPEFLWESRIPLGAITVLEGDPGSGKSTLLCEVAARLTTGRPMPFSARDSAPAGVVLLQAEDVAEWTVVPNITAAGGDLSRIVVPRRRKDLALPIVLPRDLRELEEAVELVQAKLVIVDPLTALIDANPNNDRAIRTALAPLANLAEARKIAIVLVRHCTKSGGRSALYSGAGSIAIAGLARSVLVVANDPQSDDPHRRILALTKSNLGTASSLIYRTVAQRDGGRSIEWLGESPLSSADIFGGGSQREQVSALRDACRILYSILLNGPLPANEALERGQSAGIASRTLRRAKAQLRIRSRRKGDGSKAVWYWILPDDEAILGPLRDQELDDLCDRLIHGDPLDQAADEHPRVKKTRRDENRDSGGEFDSGPSVTS